MSKRSAVSGRSPWILHYNGSSCNGCDIEVLASLTPRFDIERFGAINVGNPNHADILLVTGGVNVKAAPVLKQLYDQMLEPKVVVACGVCACCGGIFSDCYNILGGADEVIPVDVYAPGCAVRPEALIDAIVEGVGILEEKRLLLASGQSSEPGAEGAPGGSGEDGELEPVGTAGGSGEAV